jgi:shikimate kinase
VVETAKSLILSHLGDRSIVFVGLMACGKSTIGRRLAMALGLPFVDADDEIERAAGKSIKDIFVDHGEPYFRDGERRVIARLLRGGPQVLATGGGAFINDETRDNIAARGLSVWLHADLELHLRRAAKRTNRPLLEAANPRDVMQGLMRARYPFYQQADVAVKSMDVPHEVMVDEVIKAIVAFIEAGAVPGRHQAIVAE